ncbi:WPP domain-associated protein-like [Zingiber officinale]|uniref:WPP domain-associated protein-like n=1 Tax=Zingiber officinale TaxID=94328 RepID=UPI001C4A8482|nr:WPP domain-associated protein-like [Zingiber officinale]
MNAFFNGLDGRLRLSGMVADSIMMGIVNSAMEDAYKRSCTKEGDIARLIHKSRFCELAIMQLEWCLKYVQDEMNNESADHIDDREKLLCDLLETRNRIHYRLEETKIAIDDKDIEIARRKESEMKLRLTLDLKGEEVKSLHNTLGLNERVRNDNANASKIYGHVFDELECYVDKQLLKIRNKLEFGKQILSDQMYNMTTDHTDQNKHNEGFKPLHELHDIAQLMLDFDEMVTTIDAVNEEVRSSFETIASSISQFKMTTEEQCWSWNMERDVTNLMIGRFIGDIQSKYIFKSHEEMETNLVSQEKMDNSPESYEKSVKLEEDKDDMEIKAKRCERACVEQNDLECMINPIGSLSEMVVNFGLQTCEKISTNITRLDDLKQLLNPISEHVNRIKKNELLYHKAFTRRCLNLQIAEEEVDLLGDQVDQLHGVLSKVYIALDSYSLVFQHYPEIIEVIRLIQREIREEV